MRKKLLSTIMCVIMVICFMPTTAFAATAENCVAEDCSHAAAIDTTHYDTLADAVAAASANATVKLLKDVVLNSVLSINKNITIDLNGHKISNGDNLGQNYLIEIPCSANVSIVGNVENSKIEDTRTYATGRITAICVLGELTVSGEKLSISRGKNGIAIKVDESGANKQGKLTMSSGTVTSTQSIQNWGISTINGGTLNGKVSNYAYSNVAGNLTINNGVFNGEVFSAQLKYNNSWPTVSATTLIKGGIFNGGIAEYYDDGTSSLQPVERSATQAGDKESIVKVESGTFNSDPSAYKAENAKIYLTETGMYQVNDNTHSSGYNTWTLDSETGIYKESYVNYYSGGDSSSSSTTDTSTGSVVNTTETKTDGSTSGTTTVPETKATVAAETKTAEDGTKTTTATVDTVVATQIVEMAVENKSEEVIIAAAETPVVETAAGTTTEVAIPAETVSQIAEKTAAAVTIESEAAKVTLDQQAVAAVAEAAGETGTVSLVVETKAQDENKVEVELKLETSSGKVSDFKGGSVSVTVKLNETLAGKPVVCVYIDDNGNYHKVAGHKNADGTFTFTTGHFSTYAIMSEEEADAVIEAQTEKVTELLNDLTLKARSSKTTKGNIKVTLKVNKKTIKAIEDLGYTVTYKFSRSTKAASAYKAKAEKTIKTYTDKTGKKGTKYYYKARVMVYDAQGTLIAKTTLKQCKYASRIK